MATITTELVETGEKRDVRGRRVTPVARRAELVRSYQASGLTQAAFARRERLNYSTFVGWVQQMAARPPEPIQFAQMRLPVPPAPAHEAASLEVRFPDGMVMRGNNANELATLVRALRT